MFFQRSSGNPRYAMHSAAGRYLVFCFFGTTRDPASQALLKAVTNERKAFDDRHAAFFGVTLDQADAELKDSLPGIRFILDFDGSVSGLYGVLPQDAKPGDKNLPVRRMWFVTDPTLRLIATFPAAGEDGGAGQVLNYVKALPPPERFAGISLQAPILYLPNVFEPKLCQALIAEYEKSGGAESGFMREEAGKTVFASDPRHKRRRDHSLTDKNLIDLTQGRILRRIVPEILKVHQFRVTRMERYLVACYAAEDEAHFEQHRDNTTKGTAHRRFAVSINLNADFEGGDIGFPEYGPQLFKPPVGAAVVFSCSLLHRVSTVTRGKRYAFLPFLYDDAAAAVREQNLKFIQPPEEKS